MEKKFPRGFIWTYVVFCNLLLLAAYFFYDQQKNVIKRDGKNLLIYTSNLKMEQLLIWKEEKIKSATLFINNQYLKNELKEIVSNKLKSKQKRELLKILSVYRKNFSYYSITFFNAQNNILVNLGDTLLKLNKEELNKINESHKEKKILFSDFYKDDLSNNIFINLIVPMFNRNNILIGTFVFRINPGTYLYPLIQNWPATNKTSETILFEKQGNNILYLNELRHSRNAALKLSLPLNLKELPEAMHINGKTGIISGIDYRGKEVFAYCQKVHDTPWFILTKTDKSEMYSGLYARSLVILIITILIIIIIGLIILSFWRKQSERHYKELLNIEKSKRILQDKYETLLKQANDMIFIANENSSIVFVNEKVLSVYGYTEEEILKLGIKDIRTSMQPLDMKELQNKILQKGGYIFETFHKKKNGTVFPVEVSLQIIEIDGGKFIHSIIRDQTVRKNFENIITRLNRVHTVLSNINQMIIRVKDKSVLFQEACNIAVRDGGFKTAWIGIIEPDFKNINVAASAGYIGDYLKNLNTTLNEGALAGLTGYSLRLGRPKVCNDTENDQEINSKEDAYLKNDYLSFASFPLKINNNIIGIFNLYSDQKYLFNNEEIKLLEEMAGDISYAVEFLDNEAKRKITEESLVLFKSLVNQSSDSIEIIDPQTGKYIDSNEIAWKGLGYTREEFLSKTIFDIDPDIDRAIFLSSDSMLKKTGRMTVEGYHYRKDGTNFPVEISIKYINLERDYVVAISRDISEQLKVSEEINKLSRAVEQSPVSIIITDAKGDIEYVNPKLCKLTGYKKEEIIGKNPRIFKSGHTSLKEYKDLWEKISSGKEWRGELLDKMKDGTFIWEFAIISPVKNASGKITHYLAVKEDITERKRTEAQFRSVWESSSDAMRLCNENGIIIRVNNAFCKLFEKPENEFTGEIYQTAYKFIENASEVFRNNVKIKTVVKKQEAEVELWNGKKLWLDISNSIFEINNTIMVLSIFRDISERKNHEEELRAAKENAENANKTKDLFLANMSHELRTPLIGILGYSEMLMEELENTEYGEMAKGIRRSGDRLLNTLNLLLDLTRIESEKFGISITDKNIIEDLEFVVSMFRGAALEKNIDLSLKILNDDLSAKVDPGMLNIILENLINNAIKFTKTGSIELTAGKEGKKKIFIKVKDTGIGIDKMHFDKIFEEFSQVSEGLNREFQGTGLGLAISKKYVELLNGTINVESKLGEGSTFTIILPV